MCLFFRKEVTVIYNAACGTKTDEIYNSTFPFSSNWDTIPCGGMGRSRTYTVGGLQTEVTVICNSVFVGDSGGT